METRLFVARHGLTNWNQQNKYQGQSDIPLNEKGNCQARNLGQYLAGETLDAVYSSDLKRAYKTAEIVSTPHNLEVNKKKELREINFGEWQGLTYSEIETNFPERLKKWYQNPVSNCPPGGETMTEFRERVENGFNEIIKENQNNKVLVVAHGGTIKAFLTVILEMPPENYWQFDISSTGLSIIDFYKKDKAIISSINIIEHLK